MALLRPPCRYGMNDGFPGGAGNQWAASGGPQDDWQLQTDWQGGSGGLAGYQAPDVAAPQPSEFNNF